MTIAFTTSNIFQLFSAISPLLLGFFLVMSSLFNLNLKGLVYLAGVLLASAINILLMQVIKNPKSPGRNFACNMIEYPDVMTSYDSPSISSVFIAFTTAYLVLPMNYNEQMNYPVLACLLFLLGMDGYNKVRLSCTPTSGVIFGSLFGFLLGSIWYLIFHKGGYDSLLYFDELKSNKVMCSKPSKQTFKCSVYKNGQLVSSNIT